MNSKKVNWFFLTTILLHIFIVVLLVVFRYVYTMGMIVNSIVSIAIVLVPAAAVLLLSGEDWQEALGLHKIKWSTAGMIVLFTFLTMPLTTLINEFSMLFVDNVVVEISGEVMELPFLTAFFFMAVCTPVSEELAFRGVAYRGYRRSGTALKAVLFSALIFALGHMNFNQAAYAFVIGMILALLVEATGSIFASMIYHMTFNGYNVCLMYLAERIFPAELGETLPTGRDYMDSMLYSMGVSLLFAAAASVIAACVLVWIAKNERRTEPFKRIWTNRREKKDRIVTIPLAAAVVLCIAYMTADAVLYRVYG